MRASDSASRRLALPGLGVSALWVVAIGNLVLWMLARPPLQPTGRYVGELLGAEAVLAGSTPLAVQRPLTSVLLKPTERV